MKGFSSGESSLRRQTIRSSVAAMHEPDTIVAEVAVHPNTVANVSSYVNPVKGNDISRVVVRV